jgi:hypothetical protein
MRPSLGLAALALAIALPAHAETVPETGIHLAADWDVADTAAPGRPTMESFHDGIADCPETAGNWAGNWGCAGDVERLAWWVARGNRLAIRLSFTQAYDGDDTHVLAQSYGNIIKQDPTAFLAMARDEGAQGLTVIADAITTADGIADDRKAQAAELKARRAALMHVTDPGLAALRDQCVAGIGERIAAIGA